MCQRREIERLVQGMNSWDIIQLLHSCVDENKIDVALEENLDYDYTVTLTFDPIKFRELLPKYLTGEHT